MKFLCFIMSLVFFSLASNACKAEEHVIERGETSLQIAIDYGLSMEQLEQKNPDADLEMMRVGDKLIVPDEGLSFDEFLALRYDEFLQLTDSRCEITADNSALCFLYAENISDSPLYDVRIRAEVREQNGFTAQAETDIPLIQILPGEKLPLAVIVPGPFDTPEQFSFSVRNLTGGGLLQSSFRIPEIFYRQSNRFSPDFVSGTAAVDFTQEGIAVYQKKQINVLAAAYDRNGDLAAARSLFTDFYPHLEITVYSNNRQIETVELRLEAY